jgi:hypothetical protein
MESKHLDSPAECPLGGTVREGEAFLREVKTQSAPDPQLGRYQSCDFEYSAMPERQGGG